MATTLALRPASMTPQEQVQVLGLVTEMARMLKDLRVQDAQLRADFRKSSVASNARLEDFGRRLALAEAQRSVADARDDGQGAVSSSPATPGSGPANSAPTPSVSAASSARVASPPVVLTVATRLPPISVTPTGAGGTSGAPKRYRVQAASPNLAMLAEIDRGGGEGAQVPVSVGDTLPDYGRVKSISQRGTSWVVVAERGTIQ